ncbi:MAG: T9SS type A sorting domain-containing protein [Bacteroidota bacterium]|nr:T9SS type A sorting domain-containing protein [Bacteroidota bacterium]
MKKTVIIFCFITLNFALLTLNCFSQTNGGFENWVTEFNYQTPDNWQTLNFLSIFTPPNPISAFKATGIDKHSGNSALKLKTIFVNNNPVPGAINDTIGYVFTGKINISPPSLKLGVPYVGRPEKLEFWAKYLPVGMDLGAVTVILQKWNGATTDTIARTDIIIDSTIIYTLFQADLIYQSTEVPDTLIIGFSPSYKKSIARVGSTLYLDDVALTGWVGIDEQNIYSDKVKVFPNPASDEININATFDEADNIQIIDVSGKLMGNYKIQNYNANINTGLFAEGIYFYEIRDRKNEPLTKGKFNVVK